MKSLRHLNIAAVIILLAFTTGGLRAASTLDLDSDFESDFGLDPVSLPDPENNVTTAVGSGSFDLNEFMGADRYYNNGTSITGQNSIVYNLEAGHIWNGHETLGHVTRFSNSSDTWGGGGVAPLYDRHATWVGMLIGGRSTGGSPQTYQQGIAYGSDLRSAAVATGWSGDAYALSFGISGNSYKRAYEAAFGTADVVNSSFGYSDPGGASSYFTYFSDAMSQQNPNTLHVVSAGNSGPASNTVGAPGAGYNTMAVAALESANSYDSAASFSSRGPQDFAYLAGGSINTVGGVRAAVDIAAPGTSIKSAFYGGQTGGNNDTLTNSYDAGTAPDAYSEYINGTSFSSPIVAGGATLAASAAKTLPELAANGEASKSLVIKSILMTSADKTSGWDNGQELVGEGDDSFIRTTQSLDWEVGAGRMNLEQAFDVQVNGQQGVGGAGEGALGAVDAKGWDYSQSQIGISNDYVIDDPLLDDSTFTTTLAWMRWREYDSDTEDVYEVAQADLDLSVWKLDESGQFSEKVASSESDYNNEEHLSFTIAGTAKYGIRIDYDENSFDNTSGAVWGTAGNEQDYAVSWFGTIVPEPGIVLLLGVFTLALAAGRRFIRHLRANSRS